jgi:ribosomal protein L19E
MENEIKELVRESITKKMISTLGQHRSRADTDLLYVSGNERRRGLGHTEGSHIAEFTKLLEYVERKEDLRIQIVSITSNS